MKLKSVLFIASVILNVLFILILAFSLFSKSSLLSFYDPGDSYITSSAVVSSPLSGQVTFNMIEIYLTPGDKAYLQYSFLFEGKQGNLLLEALYDHGVISVSHTGYGIEITALSPGSTVMQTLTNDGIKNVAEVVVNE